MASPMRHGTVWISRGRYAGRVGYYDDDTEDRAIVYLGVPFKSKWVKIHYSEFEPIGNVRSLDLDAFRAKNARLMAELEAFRIEA